ncbi:MAG TPA: hypothetical protein PL185_07780 [Flavobacteriales bacterium]|nr:hypothetical protein [Flavobacteriales bacterium]HPH82459.1 hypothetical protein [Flavobacteriales bacterium]
MIKFKSIVLQLKEEEYNDLCQQFVETKADKYLRLLKLYRENKYNDEEIQEMLSVNTSAYYTLKSRLFDKIQDFLTNNMSTPIIDLLRKVANIPTLIYDTHRDTAIAILSKLESELQNYDMPYELSSVYSALKKLHVNSPKYYEYTQLYNKHLAYTIALDKAEDLLNTFMRTTGDYYTSRTKSQVDYLSLIKQEMAHICNLYESHHLQVYKAIVDVTFALYIPNSDALKDDEPVEDVLAKMEKIFTTYNKDTNYQHLQLVFNNLAFEYYHKLNLPKKEARYFDEVDKKLTSFLLFNHCCFTTKFLISKIERYVELGIEGELYEQNQKLLPNYEPDKNDIPNYINFSKYMATSAFYAKKYQEAVQILNNLINDISFKNYPHSEIEVKLLLALNYSMINKYDPATSLLRSVTRKIREIDDEMGYENALIFYKILSLQMSSSARQVDQKIGQLFSKFELLNQKSNRMLEYIKVDEAFIKALSQVVKR